MCVGLRLCDKLPAAALTVCGPALCARTVSGAVRRERPGRSFKKPSLFVCDSRVCAFAERARIGMIYE